MNDGEGLDYEIQRLINLSVSHIFTIISKNSENEEAFIERLAIAKEDFLHRFKEADGLYQFRKIESAKRQ